MYASIDLVYEKLQRQVKKYHDKLQHKALRHHAPKPVSAAATPEDAIADEAVALVSGEVPEPAGAAGELGVDGGNHSAESRVVKSKQFALKPMSIDEATLQLELIGHSFFVFTNAETNDTNVVYRRNDGDYGLIEPVRQ
jgi:putative sigma-54 modulation protein